MISLIDILKIHGVPLRNWKIHLATGKEPSLLEAYFQGRLETFDLLSLK
jgi:hypothetical protein